MLTKRTNLLFDENMWHTLTTIAAEKKTSVGELVRNAVRRVYTDKRIIEKRAKAIKSILAIRKVQKGRIDYKELINHGRKYL